MIRIKPVWLFWGLATLLSALALGSTLLHGKDKTLFMPGEMTGGHHQIGIACEVCHSDGFSDSEALQRSCVNCHGEYRKKPFDSHPARKFKDPRNASLLETINALECVTCHSEHRPEATLESGLTQPADFCVYCHSEIGEERPSHEGMAFDTCNSAGCHNYHNNRSLYTKFLIKHLDEPAILDVALNPERELAAVLDQIMEYPHDTYPVAVLTLEEADMPEMVASDSHQAVAEWHDSAHAASGVNCSACHVVSMKEGTEARWYNKPGDRACGSCHQLESKHFGQGKHGMKQAAGLDALTPENARLEMKKDAPDDGFGCHSCHQSHDYDSRTAAVDACLACHDDEHSQAYTASAHYTLWQKEMSGESPERSGVSCASCHMPRVSLDVNDWLSRTVVMHNQNYNLRPNEKMLRSSCLNCHGLEFSMSALMDEALINNNFQGQPDIPVEAMDLARKDKERVLRETGN